MLRIFMLCWSIFFLGAGPTLAEDSSAAEHKILMLLWRGETDAETGFRDRLAASGKNIEFTVFDAEQDIGNLSNYLRNNADELLTYDLIYTFGTTAAKATRQAVRDRVPHVFNIVSDPVRSQLVESYENRGWNRAGLAVSSTIVQQVDLVESLGLLQNVAFVFNPKEENSEDDWGVANREIQARGASAFFMRLNAETDVAQQVAASFHGQGDVSAVMLPSDSLIVSRAAELMVTFNAIGVPVFAATPKLLSEGAVAGLTSDYIERGESAAELALAILEDGSAYGVNSVPMRPTLMINTDAAAYFDITPPDDLPYRLTYLNTE